jgi:hypothetical protein
MGEAKAGTGGEKLFAFFGSDLGAKPAHFLRRLYGEGYSFLPMDTTAIGMAASSEVPYTLLDEWLGPDAIVKSREIAAECETRWFEAARDAFISEDLCWPEFDREAMYWFWHDISTANALADSFITAGVQTINCHQETRLRPALYYYPSDVMSAFWKGKLGDRIEVIQNKEKGFWSYPLLHRIFRCYGQMRAHKELVDDTAPVKNSFLSEKLVVALNHGELDRFTPLVHRLTERFPGRVAGVILTSDHQKADAISGAWSLPVAPGPHVTRGDPALREKFIGGYKRALNGAQDKPWQPFLALSPFHFRFYCEERWPLLVAKLRRWMEFWRLNRPKAVLVSALEDSESQLPTVAAKRLGIPTFSIPHGGFSPRAAVVLVADYLLYSTSIQKAIYERSGADSGRLIACRDLIAENEYPVVPRKPVSVKDGWRVLVLTNPIGTGCLAQRIFPGAQLKALRALENPPSSVAEKLSLRVKVHPGFPDLELFNVVDGRLKEQVLPLESELSVALNGSDLVVALNYCGSALLHALRAGKAVIFFWTDVSIGKVEPYTHADLLTSAGPVVRSAKEFWDCVFAFFTDKQYGGWLRREAYEYWRNHLDESLYPDISDVLSEKLNGA